MNLLALLLAQSTAPTTAGSSGGSPPPPWAQLFSGPMMPILLAVVVMYFLMMRSKSGETKKREQMLATLKKGDRVQTIGGILGTVLEARDSDVLVKVDEGSNTKMRFVRSAIQRVLAEETDKK